MSSALLVIDVQYDFLPGGSLAVQESDEILPIIRRLLDPKCKWNFVVASKDYHPAGHVSFASAHKDGKVFTAIQVPNALGGEPVQQMLWPDHCVQGTRGSDIEHSLDQEINRWISSGKGFVVNKGVHSGIDAYSAFAPAHSVSANVFPPNAVNSGGATSPLASHLSSLGVKKVFIVGLATDYCVGATALDAMKCGDFDAVYVIRESVRAVGGNDATLKYLEEFKQAGVQFVSLEDPVVRRMIEE